MFLLKGNLNIKIICILCICILGISGIQTAYAGANHGKNDGNLKEEITILNEQVKQNNSDLKELRKQMNNITVSIQKKAHKLGSPKMVITQAKVADLKTAVSLVKSSKESIKAFKNDGLKEYISSGKTAREKKEFELAQESYNNAIVLQVQRKQTLNSIISQLNTVDQLL
ncbi:hypothetical protein [Aminipila sp.]|uniref:hypothetical protein n=1 Tax=Aminipila sp. TaxID=2060095 RepID=UPI002897AF8A|nr:hypothetical protein [Aminipila sp.]